MAFIFLVNILYRYLLLTTFAVVGLKQAGKDLLSLAATCCVRHMLCQGLAFKWLSQFCTGFSDSSASSPWCK